MKCYLVLSMPAVWMKMPDYRGLYRQHGPLPKSNTDPFLALWLKYADHCESGNMGVTAEMTLDELKDFADLSAQRDGGVYEVVYFDTNPGCPHEGVFYGVDVTGFGGYSAICDVLFPPPQYYETQPGFTLRKAFRHRLNEYLLFPDKKVAEEFMVELDKVKDYFEQEDWRAVFIYSIYKTK